MLAWLPEGDGTTVYIDFALLRTAGVLDRIAGPPSVQDDEYRGFVQATGFDYRRHLDGAMVRFRDDAKMYIVAGDFDHGKLENYATAQGGRCANGLCSMPASTPGRYISFLPLDRRTMALAVSADPMSAARIRKDNSTTAVAAPMAPAWMIVPGSRLRETGDLPAGMSAFLQSLRGAERAILLLRPTKDGMDVVLEAPCASPAIANAAAGRLQEATKLLKSLIEREELAPGEKSLAGVLTSGRFRADQAVVRGFWAVPRAFLEGVAAQDAKNGSKTR